MKKLLGILAISALAASAFAQGTVTFGNQTGRVQQWTSTTDNTLVYGTAGNAMVQLIAAPAGTALNNALSGSLTPLGAFLNYSTLGAFLGANPLWTIPTGVGSNPGGLQGTAGVFNDGVLSIAGVAGGANAVYAVIGWTGTYATLDAAITAAMINNANSFIGISGVITTATGDPSASPPGTPAALKTTFTGLVMAPVYIPEPATFALAGLGLAALLMFRRRN